MRVHPPVTLIPSHHRSDILGVTLAKNEIHSTDAVDTTAEEYKNTTGTTLGTKRGIDVAAIGAAPVTNLVGEPIIWDTITLDASGATVDEYTYTLSAATQLVITITYTSSAKSTISTVVKTLS